MKIQYIMFKYIILKYIHIYPIIHFLISIAIFLWYTIYFGDVYLCDDGSGKGSEWVSEWEKNDLGDKGKDNNYQPYRPGLHPTSQGYRYEADGKEVNYQHTSQGYRHEAYGRPVDNHQYSYDSTRNVNLNQMYPENHESINNPNSNQMYNNTNETNSTKIGWIGGKSPTNSVINKYAKNNNNILHNSISNKNPSFLKTIGKFVKEDFKASRNSALDAKNKSLEESSKLISNIRDSRMHSNIIRQSRINASNNTIPKVVRRFD